MLYFFTGDDTFTASLELKKLQSQFSQIDELVLDTSWSDSALRSKLQELLQSQGLFASKRLIILREFLGEISKYPLAQKYLETILVELSTDVSVIFTQMIAPDKRLKFFKFLQKHSSVKEFLTPQGTDLEQWIANYLSQSGISIEPTALSELRVTLGDSVNLWQVQQELSKLVLYCGDSQIIKSTDVKAVVTRQLHHSVFDLTNAAAGGQTREGIEILESLLQGIQISEMRAQTLQIVGALASQIRSLLLVKEFEGQSVPLVAHTLKWKEGRVWIVSKLAKQFTQEKLIRFLADLQAIDLRLKTTEEPPKLLLSLFLQKLKI